MSAPEADTKKKELKDEVDRIFGEANALRDDMVNAIVKFRRNQLLLAETVAKLAEGKDDTSGELRGMMMQLKSASVWLGKIAQSKDAAEKSIKTMRGDLLSQTPYEVQMTVVQALDEALLYEVYRAVLAAGKETPPPAGGNNPLVDILATIAEEGPGLPDAGKE